MEIPSSILSGLENLKELYLYQCVTLIGELEELQGPLKQIVLYAKGTVNLSVLNNVEYLALAYGINIKCEAITTKIKLGSLTLSSSGYKVIPKWFNNAEECKKINIKNTLIKGWPSDGSLQLPKGINTIVINLYFKELYNANAISLLEGLSNENKVEFRKGSEYEHILHFERIPAEII
jgi:hypothetical protein